MDKTQCNHPASTPRSRWNHPLTITKTMDCNECLISSESAPRPRVGTEGQRHIPPCRSRIYRQAPTPDLSTSSFLYLVTTARHVLPPAYLNLKSKGLVYEGRESPCSRSCIYDGDVRPPEFGAAPKLVVEILNVLEDEADRTASTFWSGPAFLPSLNG